MDAKPSTTRAPRADQPKTALSRRAAAALARKRAAFALGRRSEELAAAYLEAHGLCILHRNFRRRFGEIDLVARDRSELVIVEVRGRSTSAYGGAAASIDARKKQRVTRAALLLLQQHKELSRMRVRFDVVLISHATDKPTIQWIRHAFAAT